MLTIGIVGNGFVGQATSLFQNQNFNVITYDIDPTKCIPVGTTLYDIKNQCDIIFICVPTPMNIDGSCYTGIVSKCIEDIRNTKYDRSPADYPYIVVRSTVPPETCHNLGVYHMPEFLTEKNWKQDFYNTERWIIGSNHIHQDINICKESEDFDCQQEYDFRTYIHYLFDSAKSENKIASNNITFVNTVESEMIKYTRNAFLAMKVSFCNEIYEMCNKLGISYNNIKELFPDHRITTSHTDVPGHDGHRGYGGTCLPKDTRALAVEMRNRGIIPYILEASLNRNEDIDRPEQDWCQNKGRAVIN
jgi:UDPglucose 6-dehydrogenase